ncbi:hypothetical protein F4779DRAFT_82399 [Xylariaceae sp. FL0662B]|nr:hypothetical protein F4779DRAFT_82399 [Xylariaceae sp. FL0662B]
MANMMAIFMLAIALLALPLAVTEPILVENSRNQAPLVGNFGDATPCDPIEKYTTEWFLAHTKKTHSGPLQANALFYSAGMSAAARAKARRDGQVTIWDVWPCELYRAEAASSNALRCIHRSPAQRQRFFEAMSRAFALKAAGSAMVLHAAADFARPPADGIWGRVELPVLVGADGLVQWIAKAREGWVKAFEEWSGLHEDQVKVFWERFPGAARLSSAWNPTRWKFGLGRREVERRDTGVEDGDGEGYGACPSEMELQFFDRNVAW